MTWREVKLGDFIHIKHGFAFKGEFFSNAGSHVLLTPGNCYERGGLRLKGEKEKYYIGEIPDEYLLKTGDLIVVMTDLVNSAPILGGAFFIPEDDKYLHNQRLGLVRNQDETKLDNDFIYYLLNNDAYRAQVRGSASGATVRHTAPERIYNVRIRIPDIREQRQIAQVLKAHDDLIANNWRRIELLEESARLLFKEWFRYLRYPGHEHGKLIDGLPKGWKKITIGELVEVQSGFAFKSGSYVEDGLFGIVTIKNVQDGHFDDRCDSRLQETPRRMPPHCVLSEGDILLSLTGNIGRVCIVHGNHFLLNQRVARLLPRDDAYKSFAYFFFRDENTRKRLEGISAGVAQQNLSPINMGKLELLLPPNDLMREFSDFCTPVIEQILLLTNMNSKLVESRDLLLPRLMDGRISV